MTILIDDVCRRSFIYLPLRRSLSYLLLVADGLFSLSLELRMYVLQQAITTVTQEEQEQGDCGGHWNIEANRSKAQQEKPKWRLI